MLRLLHLAEEEEGQSLVDHSCSVLPVPEEEVQDTAASLALDMVRRVLSVVAEASRACTRRRRARIVRSIPMPLDRQLRSFL